MEQLSDFKEGAFRHVRFLACLMYIMYVLWVYISKCAWFLFMHGCIITFFDMQCLYLTILT